LPFPRPKIGAAWSDRPSGVAFGLHRESFEASPFTLRFSNNLMNVESATIFTDHSSRPDYFIEETFKKE